MPTMANITVKDSDGTTDRTFTAIQGAGGDGSTALWRWEDTTKPLSMRATLEITSRWNPNRTARVVEPVFIYPITQATAVAGVLEKKGNVQFRNGKWTVPQDAASSWMISTAVHLGSNLIAAALVKDSAIYGWAPQ